MIWVDDVSSGHNTNLSDNGPFLSTTPHLKLYERLKDSPPGADFVRPETIPANISTRGRAESVAGGASSFKASPFPLPFPTYDVMPPSLGYRGVGGLYEGPWSTSLSFESILYHEYLSLQHIHLLGLVEGHSYQAIKSTRHINSINTTTLFCAIHHPLKAGLQRTRWSMPCFYYVLFRQWNPRDYQLGC